MRVDADRTGFFPSLVRTDRKVNNSVTFPQQRKNKKRQEKADHREKEYSTSDAFDSSFTLSAFYERNLITTSP